MKIDDNGLQDLMLSSRKQMRSLFLDMFAHSEEERYNLEYDLAQEGLDIDVVALPRS